MIDQELSRYVQSLLKQGFDLNTISDNLKKAGHDIQKVEEVTESVFESFNKELLDYIEKELRKGRKIDEIKNELLKIGHSEKKLKDVIRFHQRKRSLLKGLTMGEVFSKEKAWFSRWVMVYAYIFLTIIIVFLVLTYLIRSDNDTTKVLDIKGRLSKCEGISDPTHRMACNAIVHQTDKICAELPDAKAVQDCKDLSWLYGFYKAHDQSYCKRISNVNIKELCLQVAEKSCNRYFGFEGYCDSILNRDEIGCSSAEETSLYSCRTNLKIYKATNGDDPACGSIKEADAKLLCEAIAE